MWGVNFGYGVCMGEWFGDLGCVCILVMIFLLC